jgi:hypothetical protein
MNNEIRIHNRNLFKVAQDFDHIKFLELDVNRSFFFTKHGLYFNGLGKAHLAKQIASIVQLLLDKKPDPPLVLGWLTDTSLNNDILVAETSIETTVVMQSKTTHVLESCNNNMSNMSSKRIKKLRLIRTNYFLW